MTGRMSAGAGSGWPGRSEPGKLEDSDDDQRNVIVLFGASSVGRDRSHNRRHRRSGRDRRVQAIDQIDQALKAPDRAGAILGLNNTIGIEDDQIPGLQGQGFLAVFFRDADA
jgi:hypothetical protein